MDNLGPWKTANVFLKLFFLPHFVFAMLGLLQHGGGGEEEKRGREEKGGVAEQQAASWTFQEGNSDISLSRSSRAFSRRAIPKSDGYFFLCSSSFGMKYVSESSSSSASSSWRSCRGFNKPLQMSWFEITTLWKPNTKDPTLTFLPLERGGAAPPDLRREDGEEPMQTSPAAPLRGGAELLFVIVTIMQMETVIARCSVRGCIKPCKGWCWVLLCGAGWCSPSRLKSFLTMTRLVIRHAAVSLLWVLNGLWRHSSPYLVVLSTISLGL